MDILQTIWDKAIQIGLPIPTVLLTGFLYGLIHLKLSKWNDREVYYKSILNNLGQWKDALAGRMSYYEEPGSSYRTEHLDTPHYEKLMKDSSKALSTLRSEIHIAKIYLSLEAIAIMEKLFADQWSLKEYDASCESEYVKGAFKLASVAYDNILVEAKRDFKRQKWSNIIPKGNQT